MRINVDNNNVVVIDGQEVEDVDSFDYLGARMPKHGGADDEIKNRLGKATGAFNKLAKIWRSGQLRKKHQYQEGLQVQRHTVLLYVCEAWRSNDTVIHR